METNEKRVSNNIKAMLKRYDVTQEDLAGRLGITRRTIVNVVNHPFRYNIDYLNSIHIDYRGLIPKGLAIEVTK